MGKKILFILLGIVSMYTIMAQENEVHQLIDELREQYAPDGRVALFQIKATECGDTLVLEGVTTSAEAKEALLAQVMEVAPLVDDQTRLLPDAALGDKNWGVIYNSVGTIRGEPRYGAEIVTQTLLGTPVRILEKRGGWTRIQTPDRYIGWINGSVQPLTKELLDESMNHPKIIVTAHSTRSYVAPDNPSLPVSDLVAGDLLRLLTVSDTHYRVQYPDGREAFVKREDALPEEEWRATIELTGERIANHALQYMGVPYLWGGTSPKGLDCSGFTKQVYYMHGVVLARDASQQVLQGELVDEAGDFRDALPGDLVFFGTPATDENPRERVVHVGIYLGDKRFIHASDYIRINSFDPDDPLYDAFNTNRYLRTKRLIRNGKALGGAILNK